MGTSPSCQTRLPARLVNVYGLVWAVNLGVIYASFGSGAEAIASATGGDTPGSYALLAAVWRTFWFTIFAVIGALIAEITAPEPLPARPQA